MSRVPTLRPARPNPAAVSGERRYTSPYPVRLKIRALNHSRWHNSAPEHSPTWSAITGKGKRPAQPGRVRRALNFHFWKLRPTVTPQF